MRREEPERRVLCGASRWQGDRFASQIGNVFDLGVASYDEVIGVGIEACNQAAGQSTTAVRLQRGQVGTALVDQATVVEGTARFDDFDIELGVVTTNDFCDRFDELKAFTRSRAGGDDETLFATGIEIDVRTRANEEEHEQGQE
jgi:hypothetical protein